MLNTFKRLIMLFLVIHTGCIGIRNQRPGEIIPEKNLDAPGLPLIFPGDDIIRHEGYILSYNRKHKQAGWVAYILKKTQIGADIKTRRSNRFIPDPQLKINSTRTDDYQRTGYDRGHLASAADFSWSQKLMDESFYLTNISPQKPTFNRGIWKKLENMTREWATRFDSIYIVVGGILEDGLPTIGNNKISVPHFFYKVLLDYHSGQEAKAIGFIISQDAGDNPLMTYAVTVDSVEKVTGFDFFHQLPDSIEDKVEANKDLIWWFGCESTSNH